MGLEKILQLGSLIYPMVSSGANPQPNKAYGAITADEYNTANGYTEDDDDFIDGGSKTFVNPKTGDDVTDHAQKYGVQNPYQTPSWAQRTFAPQTAAFENEENAVPYMQKVGAATSKDIGTEQYVDPIMKLVPKDANGNSLFSRDQVYAMFGDRPVGAPELSSDVTAAAKLAQGGSQNEGLAQSVAAQNALQSEVARQMFGVPSKEAAASGAQADYAGNVAAGENSILPFRLGAEGTSYQNDINYNRNVRPLEIGNAGRMASEVVPPQIDYQGNQARFNLGQQPITQGIEQAGNEVGLYRGTHPTDLQTAPYSPTVDLSSGRITPADMSQPSPFWQSSLANINALTQRMNGAPPAVTALGAALNLPKLGWSPDDALNGGGHQGSVVPPVASPGGGGTNVPIAAPPGATNAATQIIPPQVSTGIKSIDDAALAGRLARMNEEAKSESDSEAQKVRQDQNFHAMKIRQLEQHIQELSSQSPHTLGYMYNPERIQQEILNAQYEIAQHKKKLGSTYE
jgi:hypothetical protein